MITDWLRIHYAIGGKAAFPKMLEKYPDVSSLYRALETRAEEHGLLRRISPERFPSFDTAQALAAEQLCRENGWRIIPFPSEYYPALLRRIKDPPAALFACGDLEILKNPRMVAVVGTRAAARKAADAAALLGGALAQAGVTVVSGGAYGIDSAAALGAAGASGAGCVTVLGRGLDPARDANCPQTNAVFITELFPGLSGRTFNFPNRNRLISGMSAGTVVMEAGGRSGALLTAADAKKQGRPVFVPDRMTLPSPGCAALAEQGAREIACPLDCVTALFPDLPTDGNDILPIRWNDAPKGRYEQSFYGAAAQRSGPTAPAAVAVPGTSAPENVPKTRPAAEPEAAPSSSPLPEGLSPEARAVAQTLTDGPRYVDEIIDRLGIPAPKVQVAVTELELEDVIAVGPGGRIYLI